MDSRAKRLAGRCGWLLTDFGTWVRHYALRGGDYVTQALATILMLLVSGSTLVGQVERPDVRPLPAVHIHDETTWSSRWFSPDGQWIWGSSLEVQHAANGQVVDGDRIKHMFRDGNDSLMLRDVSSDGKLLIVGNRIKRPFVAQHLTARLPHGNDRVGRRHGRG